MLEFPNAPTDGQLSAQPNGLTYQWSDAKTRWSAVPPSPAGGSLLKETTVEVDSVHVLDPRCVFLRVYLTGGGGGGGGINDGSGEGAQSRPGSGAATAIWWGPPDGDMTIVIGAGGIAGQGSGPTAGEDGEDSTLISAGGLINLVGGFGLLGLASSGQQNVNRVGPVGGVATGGKLNIAGGDGWSGGVISGHPTRSCSSGGSWWGVGRRTWDAAACPDNTAGWWGIGGMSNSDRANSVSRKGGGGGLGLCVIEEWLAHW